MVKYIHFTNEQKEQVSSINLEKFLLYQGEKLIDAGKEKRLASNKSITIYNNKWYDHATGEGGFPLQFVMQIYGTDYPTAMEMLLGCNGEKLMVVPSEKKPKVREEFKLPAKNINMNKTYSYLTKTRLIDKSVVDFFVEKGLIYESKELSKDGTTYYNNAIFVGKNKDGKPMHANKRSIYDGKIFKGNIKNSDAKYSFNYMGGGDKLYVFEAPIDMLSFITMYKYTNWKTQNFVALCGLSEESMFKVLGEKENIKHTVFCVDNDPAGYEFCEKMTYIFNALNFSNSIVLAKNKDWNEDLKSKYNLYALPSKVHPQLKIWNQMVSEIEVQIDKKTYSELGMKIQENWKSELFGNELKEHLREIYKNKNIEKMKEIISFFLLLITTEEQKTNKNKTVKESIFKTLENIKNNYKTYENKGKAKNQIEDINDEIKTLKIEFETANHTEMYRKIAFKMIKFFIKMEEEQLKMQEKQKNNFSLKLG